MKLETMSESQILDPVQIVVKYKQVGAGLRLEPIYKALINTIFTNK